jgi:hypothetical protein
LRARRALRYSDRWTTLAIGEPSLRLVMWKKCMETARREDYICRKR